MKLSHKDREVVLSLLEKILIWERKELDYTKLTGYKNTYRVRKWGIRIVFSVDWKTVKVLNIDYRGSVYKDI